MAFTWNTTGLTGNIGTDIININTQLGSNLGLLIAVCIFLITFLLARKANASAALSVSAFITWLSCLYMAMMGLLPAEWALIPLIILVVSVFFAWRTHNAYDV